MKTSSKHLNCRQCLDSTLPTAQRCSALVGASLCYWAVDYILSTTGHTKKERELCIHLFRPHHHCWLGRRKERLEDLNLAYTEAPDWACSHRMILLLQVFLFEILAFHSVSPFLSIFLCPISPAHRDLLPWHKPQQLEPAERPGSLLDSVTSPQMPPWNAANGYYIKAEWLTGKSFLPQNCQSLLPNPRGRGRGMVYFWAMTTAECQHLIPTRLLIFFLLLFRPQHQ